MSGPDIKYDPVVGVTVDGVPWTREQVEQAVRDAKACRESRRSGPCDCVCCQIAQLLRRTR